MSCKLGAGCYLSSVVKKTELSNIVLTECKYEPWHEVPRHEHEWLHFGFLLRGAFRESAHFGEQDCSANALIFHPVGDIHSDRFGPKGGRCFNLELNPKWDAISDWAVQADAWTDVTAHHGLAVRLYREFRDPDNVSRLAVEGLVILLTASLLRQSSRPEHAMAPWLKRVVEVLRDQPFEEHSLADLAKVARVHEVHLCREFKRHLGLTVFDYVRRTRVEHACKAIRRGKTSLGELSYDLGFSDQAQFSRTFRRVMGMTPTEYRASLRA